ncbi:hypothetical protein ACFQ3Z_37275 [Streptomyces nogalater]
MSRVIRALVYGDVDLNLIDGSAVWAQSTVQALSLAGCETRLVLKSPVHTGRLTDPLAGLPGVSVVRPAEEGLVPGQAVACPRCRRPACSPGSTGTNPAT